MDARIKTIKDSLKNIKAVEELFKGVSTNIILIKMDSSDMPLMVDRETLLNEKNFQDYSRIQGYILEKDAFCVIDETSGNPIAFIRIKYKKLDNKPSECLLDVYEAEKYFWSGNEEYANLMIDLNFKRYKKLIEEGVKKIIDSPELFFDNLTFDTSDDGGYFVQFFLLGI